LAAALDPACDGAAWCGSRSPRRAGRAGWFALDALVAPVRVLPGQADDQLLQLLVQWRSPRSAVRVGPRAGDQASVPAQQRLGLHEEARPLGAWQCPAERGEQGAVSGLEPGTCYLSAQHGELVAQNQDLQVLAASAVVAMPQLFTRLGVAGGLLIVAGGLVYSAGAAIYALRRPDPVPAFFGYHEVFHLLVIAGVAAHFLAIARYALPSG
jgi:hypothetical protein